MNLSKYIVIGVIIGALLLAFAGYRALYNRIYPLGPEASISGGVPAGVGSESVGAPYASSSAPSVHAEGASNYKIEILPLFQSGKSLVAPSLDRPIVFPASFPLEARKPMSDKINGTVAALRKNPQAFDEWLALAIFRKTIDDFEGARQIWEFLAAGNPINPTPFTNLANLYAFELKDPERAEKNFIIALGKSPNDVMLYRQAYEFYRYVRKDDAKAKETLQKGIAQLRSQDLQYLLDHYSEL